MTKVSVIIPNWNGKKLLEKCLKAVFSQSFSDFEVIVVDNGSTDGSVEFIKKTYPKVKLVQLPENLGFAPAVNLGIIQSKAPFVALLNNDTVANSNWLKNLYSLIIKKPEIFAVAPKILRISNNLVDNAGDKINIVGQAFPIGKGGKSENFNTAGYVFGASGAASLFRKEIFQKLGGFDEDFFFYFEDVDFSLRAQLAGFKCWYLPEAVVYHFGEKTAKKLGRFIEYQRFRNTIFLIIKNFPLQLFFKRGRWWKIPLVFLHTFYFFLKKGMALIALGVLFDTFCHLPNLFAKRWKIMKLRTVDINYFDSLMEDKKLKIFKLLIL